MIRLVGGLAIFLVELLVSVVFIAILALALGGAS